MYSNIIIYNIRYAVWNIKRRNAKLNSQFRRRTAQQCMKAQALLLHNHGEFAIAMTLHKLSQSGRIQAEQIFNDRYDAKKKKVRSGSTCQ